MLLSPFLTATSDVRGNLAPASAVLSPSTKDWLKDRWQAAQDMSGTPIPGEHTITLSLKNKKKKKKGGPAGQQPQQQEYRSFVVERVVLDWETAHATDYSLICRESSGGASKTLLKRGFSPKSIRKKSKKHNVDDITSASGNLVSLLDSEGQAVGFSEIELVIHRPGTQWGSSLWRFEVWGSLEA